MIAWKERAAGSGSGVVDRSTPKYLMDTEWISLDTEWISMDIEWISLATEWILNGY